MAKIRKVLAGQKSKSPTSNSKQTKTGITINRGILLVAVNSLVWALLTTYQISAQKGLLIGSLWGLAFGAFIWVIYFGYFLLKRAVKR